MELYEVKIAYTDKEAIKRWEKTIRGAVLLDTIPPRPDQLIAVRYVAVFGGYGDTAASQAASLGMNTVIGKPESWEQFEAWVKEVRYIGSVAVQEVPS